MSPNTPPTIYAGLDIAKANLQFHLAGQFHDLPNTPAGHRRLRQLLAAVPSHVVCEATGAMSATWSPPSTRPACPSAS